MNQPVLAQLPAWTDPQELFADYAQRAYCVWLDTAAGAEGISILAADPCQVVDGKGSTIAIRTPDGVRHEAGDPFAVLRRELARFDAGTDVADPRIPPGAAIGYLGYGLKNKIERLPATAVDDGQLPEFWFGFYRDLLMFDHRQQIVWQVTAGRPTAWPAPADHRPARPSVTAGCDRRLVANFSRDGYLAAVGRAKDYIAAGDIYQVNLAQRFQAQVDDPAPVVYRALREANPAPYCAYLDTGSAQVLSSSPECFLSLTDRRVVTRPIKGTRRRGRTDAEDETLAVELRAAAKDNAELLMITDLERNDLGRVCEFGSVQVTDLVRVEKYATVLHLVSTVEGRLRSGVDYLECVRACFPGGSITGAPKIRAMEIIDELEPHARGVYTGAVGLLGFGGRTAHLNIAIRTVIQQQGQLTFHAGAGIVADSQPDAEYEETMAKAEGILNAIDQLRLRQRPFHSGI